MHITVREARISELDAAGALTAGVYREDALAEPGYLPRLADAAARHRTPGTVQLVAVDTAADAAARPALDSAGHVVTAPGAPGGGGDVTGLALPELLGTVVYAIGDSEYADLAVADEAEIRMLATAHAARGRGVGEALVRACADRARAEGRPRLVLSTKPIMVTAHRLYERIGFVRTPERDWEFAPGKALLTFALPLD